MIDEHLPTGGVLIGGSARVEYRRLPKKHGKFAYHSVEGMEIRRDGTGWVLKEWILDRTVNPKRYRELVVNCETGKVEVDVDEPLAQHAGHGSARFPREK